MGSERVFVYGLVDGHGFVRYISHCQDQNTRLQMHLDYPRADGVGRLAKNETTGEGPYVVIFKRFDEDFPWTWSEVWAEEKRRRVEYAKALFRRPHG